MNYREKYEQWIFKNGDVTGAMSSSRNHFSKNNEDLKQHKWGNNRFVPGNIYTFEYIDGDVISEMNAGKSKKNYFDVRPLIISLGLDEFSEIGLNLNIMPIPARFAVLSTMHHMFESAITNNMKNKTDQWQGMPVNESVIGKLINIQPTIAINRYKRALIRNPVAIDWDHTEKVTTLYMPNSVLMNKKKSITLDGLFRSIIQK